MVDPTPGPKEMELYFSETSQGARLRAWTRGRGDYDEGITNIGQFNIRALREEYARGWLARQREDA